MYKVSVNIACYNHADYVGEAIQSVLNQTYQDFEIIILDNGSTDNSWDVINSFTDKRIKSKRILKNMQATYAGIKCMEASSGEYIALLCSDDCWEPTKLEKQVKYLDDHANMGAVFTRIQPINNVGVPDNSVNNFYHKHFNVKPNRSRHEWLRDMFYSHDHSFCCSSAIVRKKCIDKLGFWEVLAKHTQDFIFWTDVCLNYDVYIVEEKLTKMRFFKNKSNMSHLNEITLGLCLNEAHFLFERYQRITDIKEFLKVFPEVKVKFDYVDVRYIPFYLAMEALEQKHTNFKIFALLSLYRFMSLEENREGLDKYFCFNFIELYEISNRNCVNVFTPVGLQKRRADNNKEWCLLKLSEGERGYYLNICNIIKMKIWRKNKIRKE